MTRPDFPGPKAVRELPLQFRMLVPPEWEDRDRHVNVQYHLRLYELGAWKILEDGGFDEDWFSVSGTSELLTPCSVIQTSITALLNMPQNLAISGGSSMRRDRCGTMRAMKSSGSKIHALTHRETVACGGTRPGRGLRR